MALTHKADQTKRILVLGAGRDQCFMLRCAREMGIETLAVDGDPDAPGFALASQSVVISNRDVKGILAYLNHTRTRIDGVSTMGSDIPHIVAEVAHALGVPAIAHESAGLTVDKFRMKECFSAAGILVPDYALVSEADSLSALFDRWERMVVKPLNQAGSRGVSLVSDREGLPAAFAHAARFAESGVVLAERFLAGDQLSSESLIVDGAVYTPGLADRNYEDLEEYLPQILENGGWVPSKYRPEVDAIDRVIADCARALGIRNGVIKGDLVRLADGRIAVIEVAARLSGGDFSESLVPLATGVNYVKQVIRQALGWPVEIAALSPTRSKCVANRYFFANAGRLVSIEGAEALRSEPWLEKLEFSFEAGDVLPKVESHGQRLGVFVVSGPDRETVERRITQVYAGIRFRIVTDRDTPQAPLKAKAPESPEMRRAKGWKTVPSSPVEHDRETPDRRRAANSRRLLAAAAHAAVRH